MKRKLTTIEKRAFNACEEIKKYNSSLFVMEWKKSAMWGSNPSIEWHGEKASMASGCGYCKESKCLASFLQFLAPDNSILATGGAGFNAVKDIVAKHGYKLEKTFSGKREDGYSIEKIENQ